MQLQNFSGFIFRCPVFPINVSANYPNRNHIFKEAILLASPDLYNEIEKENKNSQGKAYRKTELSFLKYQIRIKSRCTPFGLFAGCGFGEITDKSGIVIDCSRSFRSFTRLDMDFLCRLSIFIAQNGAVKEKIDYYPNTSLHKIFDSYRYVEYLYSNKKRKHNLCEIESNDYLEKVLKTCENGASKTKITDTLLEENIERSEIEEYIENLIDNQIIISDIEPSVTGKDSFIKIIEKLNELNLLPEITNSLVKIQKGLNDIDHKPIGRSKLLYEAIENEIQSLNVSYEKISFSI